jgi:trigger factor
MAFTYKGLSAKLERHTVTEEEVNRQLQRLVQENPRIAEVTDRPTENGDEVVLDYAGFCDGEQFQGGTAENQTLVLGSGMFIPGFEEQLLDKVPGEKVTVKVTFPEAYHAENLAGKEAEFHCTIHAIRVKTPYQLDDTFAKEVGGCETMEAMRQRMQQSMQSYADSQGEMDLQDQLLRMAADTLDYEPTEEEVKQGIDEQMKVLQAQLSQQGLSLEMYCSFMQTTEDKLREDSRETAIATLRSQKAIDQIIDLEKLEADSADIEKAIGVIARRNNMTVEQLEPYMDAEFQKVVVKSVLTGKVMRLIRDAATVEE